MKETPNVIQALAPAGVVGVFDTTHGGFSWTEVFQVRVNFIFGCLEK